MMYLELNCGRCESGVIVDVADEYATLGIDLIHRFAKAHEGCGLVVPSYNEPDSFPQRSVKPRKPKDTD
jgi:hypothetical protein